MENRFRTVVLGLALGASLFTVGSAVAQADPGPPGVPDGRVNVLVGGSTYLDSVPDTQAVQAVTAMCTLPAPAVDAMVHAVDTAGGTESACTARTGEVVLAQNLAPALEHSPVVPGTTASFGSGSAGTDPAGPEPITGSLPTESDNMSSEN